MTSQCDDLLRELLAGVSRSFYLTLRVLPKPVRPQIGLAYLLARASDTIADTEIVPADQRLEALRGFRRNILQGRDAAGTFAAWALKQGSGMERRLLERADLLPPALREFSAGDQRLIREVLATILSGQELDLVRFGDAGPSRILALEEESELEDYTYRVAGCAGEFWTKICRAHLFPEAPVDADQLTRDGVRFGQGLQLVNILRDMPEDLRQGRCYAPRRELSRFGLAPADLRAPAAEEKFRPWRDAHLEMAEGHLRAGWAYANALPRAQWRLRLACAWPILIGLRTVDLLRASPALDPNRRVKMPRAEVKKMLWRTLWAIWRPGAWRKLVPPAPRVGGKPIASESASK